MLPQYYGELKIKKDKIDIFFAQKWVQYTKIRTF